MSTDDDERKQGVEFGSLADDLENETYPVANEALRAKYGDREIELQGGSQSLEEVLAPLGETTFDGADAVVRAVIGTVGDEAIGRKNESDRGGMAGEGSEESV